MKLCGCRFGFFVRSASHELASCMAADDAPHGGHFNASLFAYITGPRSTSVSLGPEQRGISSESVCAWIGARTRPRLRLKPGRTGTLDDTNHIPRCPNGT